VSVLPITFTNILISQGNWGGPVVRVEPDEQLQAIGVHCNGVEQFKRNEASVIGYKVNSVESFLAALLIKENLKNAKPEDSEEDDVPGFLQVQIKVSSTQELKGKSETKKQASSKAMAKVNSEGELEPLEEVKDTDAQRKDKNQEEVKPVEKIKIDQKATPAAPAMSVKKAKPVNEKSGTRRKVAGFSRTCLAGRRNINFERGFGQGAAMCRGVDGTLSK